MALSPDRGKLLTYDESGTLTLWELSTGRVLLVREDCESAIGDNSTFAFLSGDRFANEDQSGSVMICDMETGETSLFLEKALPSELASDPGGNYLAVKSFGQIRVYAGDSLEALGSYQTENTYASSGRLLFRGEDPMLFFQVPVGGEEEREERDLVVWHLSTGDQWRISMGLQRVADVEIVGDTVYVLDNYAGETIMCAESATAICSTLIFI